MRYTDTRVQFTVYADERIGTETFMFSGYHQNFYSAWCEAVTKMRYLFQGNFLTPDGSVMWSEWFDGYDLSHRDVSVDYDTPHHMTNVTVEGDKFIITDDSRNGGLKLKVTLNQSTYRKMMPGRDLEPPEVIKPKQAATSKEVNSDKHGKEVE